jgi:hypothetical protein
MGYMVYISRNDKLEWERSDIEMTGAAVRLIHGVAYFHHPKIIHHCNCEKSNFFQRCDCKGYYQLFNKNDCVLFGMDGKHFF